ncbi:hypothetical protein [Deinococcus sp.]|uniref:hypothetical protein n=1 Tax=Deinococcus sp. TaxID=47478 RepID=UPI003B5CD025
MKRIFLVPTAALILTACGGGSAPPVANQNPVIVITPTPQPSLPVKSSNQLQTERLIGNWAMNFTIINNFTFKYQLSDVRTSTVTPGDYNIFGSSASGDLVIGGYNSPLKAFALLHTTPEGEFFYVFDFAAANQVSGCTYIKSNGTDKLSDCYPMTGLHYSSTPVPLSLTSNKVALLQITAGVKVNPSIARELLNLESQLK